MHDPSFARLPLLLSVWPMAYSLIVVPTSFVGVMGWKRSLFRWRWVLHAAFLVAVTVSWIVFVLWPWNMKYDWGWLAGSLVVLPVLVVTVVFVRDPDRKLHWINLIAAVWLAIALIPGLGDRLRMVFLNYIRWTVYRSSRRPVGLGGRLHAVRETRFDSDGLSADAPSKIPPTVGMATATTRSVQLNTVDDAEGIPGANRIDGIRRIESTCRGFGDLRSATSKAASKPPAACAAASYQTRLLGNRCRPLAGI